MSRKPQTETGKARTPGGLNPILPPPIAPASPSTASGGEPLRTATRFNFRFLTIMLLAVVGAGIATKLLHDYQVRANAAQLLERAESEEKSGKRDEAVKLLNQYISLKYGGRSTFTEEEDRQHVELLIRLGKLVDPGDDPNQRAQLFRAFRTFEEVLRRDPSRRDIRRRTIEIAMKFGRYRDALEHLAVLQKDAPSDVELLKLQGECQLGVDQIVDSQLSFLEALVLDRTNPDRYVILASIWAEYPDKTIDATKTKSLDHEKFDFVRDALPGGTRGSLQCALQLSDVMCRNATPVAIARSRQARFLLDLRPSDETPPMLQKDATLKVDELIRSLDKDDDGKLTGEERRDKSVPLLADRNEDGRIDRGELIEYFLQGSYRIRFEAASAAALAAWKSFTADPSLGTVDDRADVLVSLTEANLKLADFAQFQSSGSEKARQYRKWASEFAELGQKLPLVDARFFVTTAELELSEYAGLEGKQARLERLRACERLIREGLNRAPEAGKSAPGSKPEQERQRDLVQKAAILKLQWMLVDVLYTLAAVQDGQASADALAAARAETKNLEKLSPAPSLLQLLKGRDLLVARDYAAARDQLEVLRNQIEQRSELWRRATHLLAECDARLENPDAVRDIFAVAAQVDPTMPAVFQWQLGQASALAQLGKVDEAVQAYIAILNRVQMPAARIQLIQLELARLSQQPAPRRNWSLLQTGHEPNQVLILPLPEKADDQLLMPEDARLAVLMADYAYLRALTEQQLFDVTKNPSNQAETTRFLQLAEQILVSARDKFPSEPLIPAAQIVLAARRFDQEIRARIDRSQSLLKRAIADNGDSLELRLASIQAAGSFPSDAAVEILKDAAHESNRFGPEDQSQLLQAVAKGFAGAGDLSLATDYWEQAANVQPRDLKPRLAILELLLAQAEREKSVKPLESARWNTNFERLNDLEGSAEKGPFSCVYGARKVVLVALQREGDNPDPKKLEIDFSRATKLLETAAKVRPYWATVPRTLGGIETISGNIEAALHYFEDAIKLGDRSEPVVAAVLDHYRKESKSPEAGKRSDAQDKLTQLLELIRSENASLMSGDVGRLADQILWSRSQVAEAINVNDKIRQPTADDKIRRANYELAEVDFSLPKNLSSQEVLSAAAARQKEKLGKAETLLKEAVQMSPKYPKAWMSLTEFYSRTGDISLGEQTIESAAKELPETPPHLRPFTIGWCYEALSAANEITAEKSQKLRDLAKKNYQAALDANPDEPSLQYLVAGFFARDANPQQSLRLLNRVLNSNSSISETARAQASVAKAGTLARTGRREDLDQAIELLQSAKFPSTGWQARGLRVLRRLLVQRNAAGDSRLVLKALKDLGAADSLTVEEGLELARLANAAGDWPSAKKQYQKLLHDQPEDGAVLSAYFLAQLRRTEETSALKEARSLYEQLERSQPNFYRTRAMKCRLVAAEGNRDAAVAELSTYVKGHVVEGPNTEILEKLDVNLLDDVLQNLTSVARSSGDLATLDLLTRADQLARSGSHTEAVRELKKIGNAQKIVADLRIEALRQAAELAEELGAFDQAIDLFREFAAKSPRPAAILDLARCLGRHGRGPEAVELCETKWDRLDLSQAASTEIALLRSLQRTGDEAERIAQRLLAGSQTEPNQDKKIVLLLLLGDVRDLQSRFDDAQAAFEQILQLSANHVVAKNNLAFLLANRKQAARATQLIDEAIATAGVVPELLDTKGVVLTLAGQPDAAVRILNQALEIRDSSLVRLHAAEAYRLAGNSAQSKLELEKSVSLGLDVAQLHPFDRAIFDRLKAELRLADNR